MALLESKVGLVTGSGMGIGRAIAMSFAGEGAQVVVADINDAAGRETVQLIERAGGQAVFIQGDVSVEEQVRATVQKALDTYGKLDIACNSAALSRGTGPLHEFEREVYDQTIEMCMTSTWLCMKYELQAMLAAGGGAIVNISSNSALRGHAFNSPYAAAKAGVNVLTQSAAAEYGSKGIRINAVSPGVINTPGVARLFAEQPKMAEQLKRAAVMNRLGEPAEIAAAVTFLASDRASFITGQILSVDGGAAVR